MIYLNTFLKKEKGDPYTNGPPVILEFDQCEKDGLVYCGQYCAVSVTDKIKVLIIFEDKAKYATLSSCLRKKDGGSMECWQVSSTKCWGDINRW